MASFPIRVIFTISLAVISVEKTDITAFLVHRSFNRFHYISSKWYSNGTQKISLQEQEQKKDPHLN